MSKSTKSVKSAWCPICGAKLGVGLTCPKHGKMKAYLQIDPLAAAVVAEECDKLGIEDLEEGAAVTQVVAEGSFQCPGGVC
jgi:hypothetical protein